jgi:hypothetical protein
MSTLKFSDIATDIEVFENGFQFDFGEYGVFDLMQMFDYEPSDNENLETEEMLEAQFTFLVKQFVPEQREEVRATIHQMMKDDVFTFPQIRFIIEAISEQRQKAIENYEKKIKAETGKASGPTTRATRGSKPTGQRSSVASGRQAAKPKPSPSPKK